MQRYLDEEGEATLFTKRLCLRTIDASFAEKCVDYYARNRERFKRAIPAAPPDFFTARGQAERLWREFDAALDGESLRLYLFEIGDEEFERILGDVSVYGIVRSNAQTGKLGFKSDESAEGRGFMFEALQKMVKFAFGEMCLRRIEAEVLPENVRSIKLLERLGFRKEGLARKCLEIEGVREDHFRYAILKEDL